MENQLKETTDNASKFFDEMDVKMEATANKRRKLSKEPGLSQPELSFLQFNPKANTDEENICYFNKTCFSQPNCNKSSFNKKSWKPPMKALVGSDAIEISFLSKEKFFKHDKKPSTDFLSSSTDTKCKRNVHTNNYADHISVESPSGVLLSSLFHQSITKQQTVTIDLSNSNPYIIPENKENINSFQQNTLENNLASKIINQSSICDLSPANNDVHKEIAPSKWESSISEKNVLKNVGSKSAPTLINKENSGESFTNETVLNVCETNFGRTDIMDNELIKESLGKPICKEAFSNYDKENKAVKSSKRDEITKFRGMLIQENKLVNYKVENKKDNNSQKEEIIEFSQMLTQENLSLRDRNLHQANNETVCDDKNTILNYSEHKDTGSDIIKTGTNYNDNNEHEDIISSIDLILSEGQTIPQNDLCQEEKDTSENNVEVKNNYLTLVDSVFENSSSSDDNECYDSNNSNIVANNSLLVMSKTTKPCVRKLVENNTLCKNSVEIRPEDIEKELSNINPGEDIMQKISINMLPLTDKTSEEKNKNHCDQSRTTSNEVILCDIENVQEEHIAVAEVEKNNCDVVDEEYSCLMISNSQLLEIEKNYYESPLKKESTCTTLNYKKSKVYNDVLCSKEFLSVGTQTEEYKYTSAEQCVPFKNPHLQWPSKIMESQKRLRETIQEIQRLNAILLQVRREIWPQLQQSTKEMNEASSSNNDRRNSGLNKKQ